MNKLTVGRQDAPVLPGRSYWWLVLLALPLTDAASWFAVGFWLPAANPWAVGVSTVLANVGMLVAGETVRAMPAGWRSAWGVAGAFVAALIGAVLSVAGIYVTLLIACQDGGCFG